jgi:GNAT superfamily N-acetyltransferase
MDLVRRVLELLRPSGTIVPTGPSPTRTRPARQLETFERAEIAPVRRTTIGVGELVYYLEMFEPELRAVPIVYRRFTVPKRGGGVRTILAPDEPLRALQRRITRRLFARLDSHPAATGFERGRSAVEHAAIHAGKAVVVRMDVRDFFTNTRAERVDAFFRRLGWDAEATRLLVAWCTYDGSLPQGAPTSPRLSNLLNRRIDARLAALAAGMGATYTRYADDITFSFETDDPISIHRAIRMTKRTLAEDGYELHERRKLHVRRQHQRQVVGGLVVNVHPSLPRARRRWLRAVDHRRRMGRSVTLTNEQLAGWNAYRRMVEIGPPVPGRGGGGTSGGGISGAGGGTSRTG